MKRNSLTNGINENVCLFNLQVVTLYLVPEGISSYCLWRIWLGSTYIFKWTVPVAQWLSIVLAAQKVMGSIPREHTY